MVSSSRTASRLFSHGKQALNKNTGRGVDGTSAAILLEIKSRVSGQEKKAAELAADKKLRYIKKDGENLVLNQKHKYFSQVQLGMFLLNLNLTHFVVYSKVEPLILTIPRCDNHIDMLVRKLKLQAVYFKHLLPQLAVSV
ncbi:hypothetical protein HPB48_013648 [Haemaphysalis longicornis]|uniref:Uncharacterized protein n=1 Tax=Haemaphysalis longicornis TaxID=44386 RepID=A0A9J6FYV3_HAELO|nr:hypothetical protein HPB48_013648 [Haemaphysalis longicornis]